MLLSSGNKSIAGIFIRCFLLSTRLYEGRETALRLDGKRKA